MKRKIYEVVLSTIGPVHVGNGEKKNKSQYLYDFRDKRVYIPDEKKFFDWIMNKGLIDSFEKFIMGKNNNLYNWITHNNLKKDFSKTIDYELDTSSIFTSKRIHFNDIAVMTKDKDNNPYIPGSSLKGFIRNAIINYEFNKLKVKDKSKGDFLRKYYNEGKNRRNNRNNVNQIERDGRNLVNNILKDKSIDTKDYLSIMRNILVSDSQTVSKNNLILAQKVDTNVDKKNNSLPIFRESIKPDTNIKFEMIIKDNAYIDIDSIIEAIEILYLEIDNVFLQYFGIEERENLLCYIGGGTGYMSKTGTYSLLGENEGKRIVNQIMKDLFPKGGHNKGRVEISPKTLKRTNYNRRYIEMGLCSIEFREKEII